MELIAFSSLFTRVMDTICIELCVLLLITLSYTFNIVRTNIDLLEVSRNATQPTVICPRALAYR